MTVQDKIHDAVRAAFHEGYITGAAEAGGVVDEATKIHAEAAWLSSGGARAFGLGVQPPPDPVAEDRADWDREQRW